MCEMWTVNNKKLPPKSIDLCYLPEGLKDTGEEIKMTWLGPLTTNKSHTSEAGSDENKLDLFVLQQKLMENIFRCL